MSPRTFSAGSATDARPLASDLEQIGQVLQHDRTAWLVKPGDPDAIAAGLKVLIDPAEERKVPVIVVEEILRGRLNAIRQAEAGRSIISIERAYRYLEESVVSFRYVPLLSYSSEAESLFQQWRRTKVRGSTHDLRIAATCVAHVATLISHNRRDFDHVPGLIVEYWT